MARIRTIKPEFWTAEQVMDLSPLARLAFIGLWNFCDDQGVHPASPKTLKAEVFPSDDITVAQVETLVEEMTRVGLLLVFECGGKCYWHVTGWHHQKIDKPSRKYPAPPDPAPRTFPEHSPTPPGPAPDPSGTEWSSRVREKEREEELKPTAPGCVSAPSTVPAPATDDNETRKGALCKRLRGLGIDAAPHLAAWPDLLAGYSDAEIISAAESARDSKPGQRIHLNYLLPMLSDRKAPRGPPRRSSFEESREAASAFLTGRTPNHDPRPVEPPAIPGEARRLAG